MCIFGFEGIAAPWDGENVTYEFGDTVKWGGTDALGNVIEVDSLLYIYNVENQTDDLLGNINPGVGASIFGVPIWRQVAQPGSIVVRLKLVWKHLMVIVILVWLGHLLIMELQICLIIP